MILFLKLTLWPIEIFFLTALIVLLNTFYTKNLTYTQQIHIGQRIWLLILLFNLSTAALIAVYN